MNEVKHDKNGTNDNDNIACEVDTQHQHFLTLFEVVLGVKGLHGEGRVINAHKGVDETCTQRGVNVLHGEFPA